MSDAPNTDPRIAFATKRTMLASFRTAQALLTPYDARLMRCYTVSARINHVANDDEGCSRCVEITEAQHPLFT